MKKWDVVAKWAVIQGNKAQVFETHADAVCFALSAVGDGDALLARVSSKYSVSVENVK